MFDLNLIYVVDTKNVSSNVKIIFKTPLPVMRYGVHKFKNCFSIFSEMVKDRAMKFSEMIDISIRVCKGGLVMSAVTSGHHRK